VLQAGTHQQRQTQKCLNSGIGVQTLFEHTCLNMFEHIAHLYRQRHRTSQLRTPTNTATAAWPAPATHLYPHHSTDIT
jgi:hypothetical protein